MEITKDKNVNEGKMSVYRRLFEVVYYNSLMISEESFEAIKKSDLLKEDDEGVIYFPNIIKNMVWFVWFEKIEHNSKIYYEITRVKYILPDRFTDRWLVADFGPLSRQLEFMFFSILNGCVKAKTNHDMEDCYIRDCTKGDVALVKMGKWDSYTSLLPAIRSFYVTCVFKEDTNKRLDYNDLKNCT